MKLTPLSKALILTSILSAPTYAAYSVDARADAMGGVGVVSATYLTAPFYNPALAAIYRKSDDLGMLVPSFGISYTDQDGLTDNISDLADIIEEQDWTNTNIDDILDDMNGTSAGLKLGGAVAVGIPNSLLSATLFGKAYSDSFINTQMYTDGTTAADNAELSVLDVSTIAILEAGVSLAKYQTIFGQHMSFGVSPKIQRVTNYIYTASVENYDIYDVFDNRNSDNGFNIDAGALWFYGPFRIGLTGSNLISREFQTNEINTTLTSTLSSDTTTVNSQYTYKMEPQFTVGIGMVLDYFSLSLDYDLNEVENFDQLDDNTQWMRVGMEIDLLRQIQFRAGYKRNLAYDDEDTITAGIGLSPLGIVEIDLAVSYTDKDSKGAYVNFLTTY